MKNLFTLLAVAAAFTLTSCQTTKSDCSSCTKPAAACKDGTCKDGAKKECCGSCKKKS